MPILIVIPIPIFKRYLFKILDYFNQNSPTIYHVSAYLTRRRRSRHRRCSMRKGVLRNVAKFTGKHVCQSLFFNKVAGLFLQLY